MLRIDNIKPLTDQLKCTQCNKLLSVLPVYNCSAIGNVCGRCWSTVDCRICTLERAVAYEAVAKYLVFPCSYKENGCGAKLKWNEVEEHEKSCSFIDFKCPFDGDAGCAINCRWRGDLKDLVDHLQVNHNEIQQTPSSSSHFVMDVTKDNANVYLITVKGQIFILLTKYVKDSNKVSCTVMCVAKEPQNQCYRFLLEIGRCNYHFVIGLKDTEPFVNTAEIIDNCYKMTTVDVASFAERFIFKSNGTLCCIVRIAKKGKREVAAILESSLDEQPITSCQHCQPSKNPPQAGKKFTPSKNSPQSPKLPKNSLQQPKNLVMNSPCRKSQTKNYKPSKVSEKHKANASSSADKLAKMLSQLDLLELELVLPDGKPRFP